MHWQSPEWEGSVGVERPRIQPSLPRGSVPFPPLHVQAVAFTQPAPWQVTRAEQQRHLGDEPLVTLFGG